MSNAQSTQSPLDRDYLPIRAKILEIAAAMDRIQRSGDSALADARWQHLLSAIDILPSLDEGRAERVQMPFSRPYDASWRSRLGL